MTFIKFYYSKLHLEKKYKQSGYIIIKISILEEICLENYFCGNNLAFHFIFFHFFLWTRSISRSNHHLHPNLHANDHAKS